METRRRKAVGYSKTKTDGFGGKYTQHYDDDGHKTGWEKEKSDSCGGRWTTHHDNSSNETGHTVHHPDGTNTHYDK